MMTKRHFISRGSGLCEKYRTYKHVYFQYISLINLQVRQALCVPSLFLSLSVYLSLSPRETGRPSQTSTLRPFPLSIPLCLSIPLSQGDRTTKSDKHFASLPSFYPYLSIYPSLPGRQDDQVRQALCVPSLSLSLSVYLFLSPRETGRPSQTSTLRPFPLSIPICLSIPLSQGDRTTKSRYSAVARV